MHTEPRFPIHAGVPIPPGGTRTRVSEYPFARMSVGDSFPIADQQARNAAARAARYYEKRNAGVKFTTRKVEGGFRLWRTV